MLTLFNYMLQIILRYLIEFNYKLITLGYLLFLNTISNWDQSEIANTYKPKAR